MHTCGPPDGAELAVHRGRERSGKLLRRGRVHRRASVAQHHEGDRRLPLHRVAYADDLQRQREKAERELKLLRERADIDVVRGTEHPGRHLGEPRVALLEQFEDAAGSVKARSVVSGSCRVQRDQGRVEGDARVPVFELDKPSSLRK